MKKLLSILTVFILSFSLVACGGNSTSTDAKKEDTKQEEKQEEIKNKSDLDGLKKAYEEAGFKVSENEIVAFQMVGASNGYKFKVDDELIEIYEYDMKNLNEDGKKYVEQAKKGQISISGFNVPVKLKNNLMLVRYNEHSKKEKILEVFNNY